LKALAQIASALFGLVLFAAAFVFAWLVLVLAALGALMLWGWILWRSRRARRAAGRAAQRGETLVIEGEYVVDRDERLPAGGDRKDPNA
jgi:hypothetical protein